MSIKSKIALIFTLLVTIILLLLGSSIYYYSSVKRTKEFGDRLRNRALTTARLLLEVEEMDEDLLRKIDSVTMNLLYDETISIYNEKDELLYVNDKSIKEVEKTNHEFLKRIRLNKELRFSMNEFEAVGVALGDKFNNYVVLAQAIDKTGKENLSQLEKILLISGAIGILITILTGYFFSTNLIKPLNRMNREMNDITSSNLSQRIPINKNKNELNELATTFNNLLERLETSFDNQKRFIANASHELSTPLAAVSSQLEVALMHERDDAEYREVLISVQEDVAQLNKLVKKLLELAKAGAGSGISLEPVRLDDIVLNTIEEIKKLHKDYSINFSFEVIPEEEDLCFIYGNEELLFIAIRNIIENACKYSPGHKAWVTLSVNTEKKIIRIRDDGIGISKDEINKVFEPFFRTSKAQQITDGLGLGLSMSSRIIRLHKGEINIDSTPGSGSIFNVILPSI